MIDVSGQFVEVMESNYRPFFTPVINVSGKDKNGNNRVFVRGAEHISNFSFKSGIDPIGRTLPYMTLVWEENITGELSDVQKAMTLMNTAAVDIYINQNLSFDSDSEIEQIHIARLFLCGTPIMERNKIQWQASDLLSLLVKNETKIYNVTESTPIPSLNPAIALLVNAQSSYVGNEAVIEAIQKSITNFTTLQEKTNSFFSGVLFFNNSTKNTLLNYLNLFNMHMSFDHAGAICAVDGYRRWQSSQFKITPKLMYELPTIQQQRNISEYQFKQYLYASAPQKSYIISQSGEYLTHPDGYRYYKYYYDGFGHVDRDTILNKDALYFEAATYALSDTELAGVRIIPYQLTQNLQRLKSTGINGQPYIEENPLCTWTSTDMGAYRRAIFLSHYINEDNSIVTFSGLPFYHIEVGDFAIIETGRYDRYEQTNEEKEVIVISCALQYNGAIKATYIGQEIKEYG